MCSSPSDPATRVAAFLHSGRSRVYDVASYGTRHKLRAVLWYCQRRFHPPER